MGRIDSERARRELLAKMAGYHRRAEQDFVRRRRAEEAAIAHAVRTSP